jgi:hypothetical protein
VFTEFISILSHFPGSVTFLPGLVAPGLVAPGLVAPGLVAPALVSVPVLYKDCFVPRTTLSRGCFITKFLGWKIHRMFRPGTFCQGTQWPLGRLPTNVRGECSYHTPIGALFGLWNCPEPIVLIILKSLCFWQHALLPQKSARSADFIKFWCHLLKLVLSWHYHDCMTTLPVIIIMLSWHYYNIQKIFWCSLIVRISVF